MIGVVKVVIGKFPKLRGRFTWLASPSSLELMMVANLSVMAFLKAQDIRADLQGFKFDREI